MKKIFSLALGLAAMLAFTACSNDVDDLFNESSSERISNALNNTEKVLTSASNGWVLDYYSSRLYGGYNVLCKFNTNGNVEIASEAGSPSVKETSHYTVSQSQGVMLSFDTYNKLFHYFSDPHNPSNIGDDGKGMNGDFEFRVLKATADSVILVGTKHGQKLVMTPAPTDKTWEQYLTEVYNVSKAMVVEHYQYLNGEDKQRADLSYNVMTLQTKDSTGAITDVDMNFIVKLDGIHFRKGYNVNGKVLTGFAYPADADGNYHELADNNVVLAPYIAPLSEMITLKPWFIDVANSGAALKTAMQNMGAVGKAVGYPISTVLLYTSQEGGWGLSFIAGGYYGSMYLSLTAVDDTHIKLYPTGKGDGNGSIFMNSFGFKVGLTPFGTAASPKTFTITADNVKDPTTLTLTDQSDPTNTIVVTTARQTFPY